MLSRLPPNDVSVVLIIPILGVLLTLVILGGWIISAVQRHREREIAASVVDHMLDRGVAPQEIVAVLRAMGLKEMPRSQDKVGRGKEVAAERHLEANVPV